MLLVLVCLALVVRGRIMLSNADNLLKDPDAYASVSWNIAHRHRIAVYREEFDKTLPTATRPILYPVVLAVFDALPVATDPYGYGWLHVVLGVGTVWATWRLGLAWRLTARESLLAAGLVALDPILVGQSVLTMTETLATFLAAVTLLALSRAGHDAAVRWSALAGALLGLCVLCRPVFLVWTLLAIAAFARCAVGGRKWARSAALCCAAGAVIAPWAIRNQRLFNWPIVTTTHGGFTLLLANNPQFYEFLRTGAWGSVWDGKPIYDEWRRQQELLDTPAGPVVDELAADRWAYAQGWQNIRGEPAMFAYACLVRWGRLWGLVPHAASADESPSRRGLRFAIGFWYAFEFALALVGIWCARRQLLEIPWLWGTLLVVTFMVVHAVFWTDMRMRAPLTMVVCLLAARGIGVLAAPRRYSNALLDAT
jgi:hypothetical protein